MNKIIMIMHMFKCCCFLPFNSLHLKKNPKITQNAAYFFPIQARGLFPK